MQGTTLFEKRYVLLEPLGAGAMGEVYRALDRLTNQTVALKRVRLAGHVGNKSERELHRLRLALAQEFQILASLRHPNIITVLDYGFDADRTPYFTMPLLQSPQTILEAAADQTVDAKVDLLVQVLRALAYLHRRGILHRDLKPNNILVTNGQVKVLDFGLAVTRERAMGMVGTIAYMAPEVIRGERSDESTDLYATGVLAYELLSGRCPFEGQKISEILNAILYLAPDMSRLFDTHAFDYPGPAAPESPSTVHLDHQATILLPDSIGLDGLTEGLRHLISEAIDDPGLSVEVRLSVIVSRLLQKRPQDRYREALTVIHDFSAAVGEPLPAETTSTRESFLQAARFVGRDREVAELEEAMVQAFSGSGSGWLIGGESGVGKSRLLDEIRIQALVKGALVLRGQALSEGGAPYHLWRESLRWLSLLTDLSDLEAEVLKTLVPDIADLLGREVADPPEIGADAAVNRLLNVIDAVFRKQQQPIMLILEDLHWAEEDLQVLKRLLRHVQSLPLIIVASYRDDERPELPLQLPGIGLVSLKRLEEKNIAELSESMLGPGGRQPNIVRFLQRETEGNAFFLVEVVRVLAEEVGRLDQIGTMTLPETVISGGIHRIVERRLGRVPEDSRPLLELAAVMGRQIDTNVLRRKTAGGVEALESWLTACAAAAVIEVKENQWRFSHDKIREGLLATLDSNYRRKLHGMAGDAIEAVYADVPQQAGALAYHFAAGGNPSKEAHYSSAAGDYAFRAGAYTDAIKLLRRTLEIYDDDPAPPLTRAAVERTLGEAFFGIGPNESRIHLERALTLLGHSIPGSRFGLTFMLGKCVMEQVLHATLPGKVRSWIWDEKHRVLWIETSRALERLGHAYYHLGDAQRSVVASMMNLNVAERAGLCPELARTYGQQIVAAGMVRIHFLANRFWRLAQDTAEKVEQPAALAWVWLVAAVYLGSVGRWNEADELLQNANREHERLGNRRRWEEGTVIRAVALMLRGLLPDAQILWNDLYPAAAASDDAEAQGFAKLGQALMWELHAEFDTAIEAVAEARTFLEGKGPSNEAWVYGVESRIQLHRQEFELAQESARKGLERIAALQPLGFYMLEGYAGVAETYLGLLENNKSTAMDQQALQASARKAVRSFCRFATVFPVAQPRARLSEGRLLWLTGRRRKAQKVWNAALDQAKSLSMPYEQGLLHSELGRSVSSIADQEQHMNRAREIFTHLGISVKLFSDDWAADPQRYA